MNAGVPIRPFVAGKLRTLLGGEEHERVLLLAVGLEGIENLADLAVHVGDLGEVLGEVLPGAKRVCDVRRQLEFRRRVLRWVAHHPRHMRLHQRDDKAERLPGITLHETADAVEFVGSGGVANTTGIEAADIFERKRRRRFDVHLAGDAHSVAQRAEVVRHALDGRLAGGVIPRAAVMQRVLAGHQLRTARLAHRLGEPGAVEGESLAGQAIDVRRLRVLASVQRQVVVCAVVGHDDEKVGPLGQGVARLAKRNE